MPPSNMGMPGSAAPDDPADRKPGRSFSLTFALASAALAAIIGGLTILVAMRNTGLMGDEYTYTAGAKALADHAAGRTGDIGSLGDTIFGTGWFMPGLYVLGAPLYLVVPEPAFWQIRAWSLGLNALLFVVLIIRLGHIAGRRAAGLLLVFPALAPLWHVGAQSFLPDLPAALLNAIGLTIAYRIGTGLAAGRGCRTGARSLRWRCALRHRSTSAGQHWW